MARDREADRDPAETAPADFDRTERLPEIEEISARLSETLGMQGESAAETRATGPPERPQTAPAPGAGRPHYVLKGEVGRGGMGTVLRVFDTDLRRNLAMKVMRPASGSGSGEEAGGKVDREALSRFLEEAQVTGQLDHPGVVPVHEVGVDSRGRVYFTMRLVKGRDLRKVFLLVRKGREDWTLRRALVVLLKVCDAMSYAHDKGVVHRDLKPSNVMVGRYGEVYVMDWGLARVEGRKDRHDARLQSSLDLSRSAIVTDRKAAREHGEDSPLVTMDGTVVGTPFYMPPEQALGCIKEIGPRSDVYSVGAMLYELLGGRMPYKTPGSHPSPHTVLAMVAHAPPQPLRELAPEVSGELIAICEKAMAREPADRYANMGELGHDLRAHIEHRVVSVYRKGAVAELTKWVERNRTMAVSLAAAALLAVSALVWGNIKARSAAGRAREQADVATAAQSAMSDLFRSLDPLQGDRQILDARADDAIASLADQPLAKANVLTTVADVWESARLYDKPLEWRREVLEIRRTAPSTTDEELAEALYRFGRALGKRERHDEAEGILREALDLRRGNGQTGEVLGPLQRELAKSRWHQGEYEEARGLFLDALADTRAADPRDERLSALIDFGSFLEDRGELREAEARFREALAATRGERASERRLAAEARFRLGRMLWNTPRFPQAEAHLRAATAFLDPRSSEDAGLYLDCLWELCLLHHDRRQRDLAWSMGGPLKDETERQYGEESIEYAIACYKLAGFGGTDARRSHASEALRLYDGLFGPNDPRRVGPIELAGTVQSDPNDGRELLEEALALREATLGDDHWKTAFCAARLGRSLKKLGRYEDASEALETSYERLEQLLGSDHPRSSDVLGWIRQLYKSWGKELPSRYEDRLSALRGWPYYSNFGYERVRPQTAVSVDYSDDFAEKTIVIDKIAEGVESARLWILGLPFNDSGRSFRPIEDHRIIVNDDPAQVVSFDLRRTFDCPFDLRGFPKVGSKNEGEAYDTFRWAPIEIPVDWLVSGPNTFRVYEWTPDAYQDHDQLPLEWEFNNLLIAVTAPDHDDDASWWAENVRAAKYEGPEGIGRLMEQWIAQLDEDAGERVELRPQDLDDARREARRMCEGELQMFVELCTDE